MHKKYSNKKNSIIAIVIAALVVIVCGFFLYRSYRSAPMVSDDQPFPIVPTLTKEMIVQKINESAELDNLDTLELLMREIFLQRFQELNVTLLEKEAQVLVDNAHRVINGYTQEKIAQADSKTLDSLIKVFQFIAYYGGTLDSDDKDKLKYAIKKQNDELPVEQIDAVADTIIEAMKYANLLIEEKKQNPSLGWQNLLNPAGE